MKIPEKAAILPTGEAQGEQSMNQFVDDLFELKLILDNLCAK